MQAELAQRGLRLDQRDIFDQPFTGDELRRLIGSRSPADYFSWNSPSFKKLGLSRDDLTADQLIEMMAREPRLIRRPLIQLGDHLIVGTDKKALSEALG